MTHCRIPAMDTFSNILSDGNGAAGFWLNRSVLYIKNSLIYKGLQCETQQGIGLHLCVTHKIMELVSLLKKPGLLIEDKPSQRYNVSVVSIHEM